MRITATFALLIAFVIGCRAQTVAGAKFAVGEVRFESIFGECREEPETTYCLLARGYFMAPKSNNLDSLLLDWSGLHPGAKVVPVTSYGLTKINQPDSRMIYCWIVDNRDTLNLHLVKQGAYSGHTMLRHETWNELPDWEKELYREAGEVSNVQVLVDSNAYNIFLQQLIKAEEYATVNNLGIWAGDLGE